MQEKINLLKWFTELTPQKRSVVIIVVLSGVIYGFGQYIEDANIRDREECRDSVRRITCERDSIQNKLEKANERHLKYVEERNKRYEELYIKTQQLEKQSR